MSKDKIKEKIAERDNIDDQLKCLHEVLKSNNVDMKTPLVDEEGFPVDHLDIISIRKARHSIICLMNDRKKVTDDIEAMLVELHEKARSESVHADEPMQQDSLDTDIDVVHRTSNKPFLKLENVVNGSPANKGGLLVDDVIIQCGPVFADNFEGLQKFSEMISEHVGKELKVTVLRSSSVRRLTVHPGKWEGVGVFGARFSIIKDE